jgi:hypothetical protein
MIASDLMFSYIEQVSRSLRFRVWTGTARSKVWWAGSLGRYTHTTSTAGGGVVEEPTY